MARILMAVALIAAAGSLLLATAQDTGSIAKQHETTIYGVKIGMDVPTALEAVFVNAQRKPGQERPDARRNEGKDNKDVRVVYRELPGGEMQIVFADGKVVKEIILRYSQVQRVSEFRLPNSSGMGEVTSGERFDDRYTIGFVDNKKQEKLWWRDETTSTGYGVRLSFLSGNLTKDTTMWWQTIVQKTLTVKKDDEAKFREAFKL